MAGLKKNRITDYFDISKEYEKLGIKEVEPEEVYAMVPVEFSYEKGSREMTVERYAAVRDEKELEKVLKLLEGEKLTEDELDNVKSASLNAGIVIRGAQLDNIKTRPFFYKKDNAKEIIRNYRYDFFGRNDSRKAKLYLDDMKDIEKIDWLDVFKDKKRADKEYTIGLDKDERVAEKAALKAEKAADKAKAPKRIPVNDRIKEEASKAKTRDVVILSFGSSPANTVVGDVKTVSAKEEELKDKGVPVQLLKKEIKTVRDNRVTKVPVVTPPVQPYNTRVDEGGRSR